MSEYTGWDATAAAQELERAQLFRTQQLQRITVRQLSEKYWSEGQQARKKTNDTRNA